MSPASYRTAPPRVARTTLPSGEQQAKSRRRDLRLRIGATPPVSFQVHEEGPPSVPLAGADGGPSTLVCPEPQLLGVGAGVADGDCSEAGVVAAIFASAPMAFCSAAFSFFCCSP